jgi:hypothetical protein
MTEATGRDPLLSTAAGMPVVVRQPVAHLQAPLRADRWGWRLLAVTVAGWALSPVMGFEFALSVITAIGFAAAIAGLTVPAAGAIGIALLCTIDALTRHLLMDGGLLRWNTLTYWIVLVSLVWIRDVARLTSLPFTLFKAFLLILVLQLAYSADRYLGTQHVLGIAIVPGLWLYQHRAGADPRTFFWQGVICSTTGVLGGLLFNLQRDQLPFMNYNAWGLFPMTAMIMAAIGMAHATQLPSRLYLAFCAGVNLTWVLLSGSRGDLAISLTCLLFVLALLPGARSRVLAVTAVVALAVGSATLFPDMRAHALSRIEKLFDAEQSIESRTSGRSDLLKGGWYIFTQQPLGVGTGGFMSAWARLGYVEGISGFRAGEYFPAHAGWIKVLSENGVVGIVLFAAFVGSFAACGWRHPDAATSKLAMMTTAVLAVALWSTEFQGKGFWLLVGTSLHLLGTGDRQVAAAGVPWRAIWRPDRREAAVP